MSQPLPDDVWATATAYEPFIGRWSQLVAAEFLPWLAIGPAQSWLDVGCGTGMLTRAILRLGDPREVVGIDPSAGFVAYAGSHVSDPRARFMVGDAGTLAFDDAAFDAVVSGLVLNFVPQPLSGMAEMLRVTRPGGSVAAYVWDYAEGMQLLRRFWDAVVELAPAARHLDEAQRFPLCRPEALTDLFVTAGLRGVSSRAIDVATVFADLDDLWSPFLGGQGPAPTYVASLDEDHRAALRERLRASLPFAADGSIHLVARAWAIRGER